jgi:hypothetical protein
LPRGGGRNWDRIVRHTLAAELGLRPPLEALLTEAG